MRDMVSDIGPFHVSRAMVWDISLPCLDAYRKISPNPMPSNSISYGVIRGKAYEPDVYVNKIVHDVQHACK